MTRRSSHPLVSASRRLVLVGPSVVAGALLYHRVRRCDAGSADAVARRVLRPVDMVRCARDLHVCVDPHPLELHGVRPHARKWPRFVFIGR